MPVQNPRSTCRAALSSGKSILLTLLTCCCAIAHAGPPFVTDDPVPVDRHHTEVNLALQGTRADAGRTGTLSADVNYGCARELQCHIALPLAFASSPGAGWQAGVGDIELGAKYRFFNRQEDGWMAAIYPTVFLPSGAASRGLGNGHAQVLLPLWVQKASGPWTWDAGAGYLVNRAADARNSWYLGVLAQRSFGEGLSLGAELFHRTPLAQDAPSTSGFNLGATVKLSDTRNLLVSVGRGFQDVAANRFSFYAAYQLEL
nr:transporter [Ramlibacter ginsenosidimutans]